MTPDTDWCQYVVEFTDPATAEGIAAQQLAPALDRAQAEGLLNTWWYMRKHPEWRVRFRSARPGPAPFEDHLNQLVSQGLIANWKRDIIYEPEVLAFGGPAGMDIAHTAFHHDSHHLLASVADQPALGRRETTVLLYSTLLRGAGLDWFEQGDTWAKVADELRPAAIAHALVPERREHLGRAVRTLMKADAASAPDLVLPQPWIDAWATTGQRVACLARQGELQRGLRAVLAHYFIFHANRAGLSGADQATLVDLAISTVFHKPDPPRPVHTNPNMTKVREMTTAISDTTSGSASAEELRNRLTDRLAEAGTVRTASVEAALRIVPRELFVPGVPLAEAYADDAVYTKRDGGGAYISAASQPTIVAMMLEQLQIHPGQRILELGAGTGYNAALMGQLTGPDGHVTAIDVDEDLVEDARKHLAAASVGNVDVVMADGALGYRANAPYDRTIATVGAHEVPAAWLEQLAPYGRLVVPIRLAGAASRSVTFECEGDTWVSRDSRMAVFMPLRGLGDDARQIIDLTGDGEVTLQVHKDNRAGTDSVALTGALDTERSEVWTGVVFAPMESFEWLDLWLCCRLANPLMRMSVEANAKDSGLVAPMFPTVTMATTAADGSLAYLTIRAADPATDGSRRYEVGVIGHGPAGQQLAEHVSQEINLWDRGFRTRTVRIALPYTAPAAEPDAGRFVLARPQTPITVTWE